MKIEININNKLWGEVRKAMCVYFECSDGDDKQFPECNMYGTSVRCPLTCGKEILAKSIIECVLRQIITWG